MFALFPRLVGDFSSSSDSMFGNANNLIETLRAERRALLVTDALTSFAYILIAFAIIYFTIKAKWKPALSMTMTLLSVAVIVNMWSVDKRYLNKSHFVKEKVFKKNLPNAPR